MPQITTFLMFTGNAEEAMTFYVSLFPGSAIASISRYDDAGPGAAGTVHHAAFTLAGQPFMAIDSPITHGFTFTPSLSLHVTCETEAEIDALFEKLSAGGEVLMPLDAYPFSQKYGWVNDRFGVSWQVTLG